MLKNLTLVVLAVASLTACATDGVKPAPSLPVLLPSQLPPAQPVVVSLQSPTLEAAIRDEIQKAADKSGPMRLIPSFKPTVWFALPAGLANPAVDRARLYIEIACAKSEVICQTRQVPQGTPPLLDAVNIVEPPPAVAAVATSQTKRKK